MRMNDSDNRNRSQETNNVSITDIRRIMLLDLDNDKGMNAIKIALLLISNNKYTLAKQKLYGALNAENDRVKLFASHNLSVLYNLLGNSKISELYRMNACSMDYDNELENIDQFDFYFAS